MKDLPAPPWDCNVTRRNHDSLLPFLTYLVFCAFEATPQNMPLAPGAAPSPAQKALRKLGLVRPIDLALHLPLRYEDETRITPLKNAREGSVVQIEAPVTASEVQ